MNRGSYYLTSNLHTMEPRGITIAASSVTIDLMGYELSGAGAGTGIAVSNLQSDIAIRNGTVRGWMVGISGSNGRNSLYEQLCLSGNGDAGLWAGGNVSIVRACTAYGNGGVGILGGRGALITNCNAAQNGDDGIRLFQHGVVESSVATDNGGHGIAGGVTCRVRDSTSSRNTGSGIYLEAAAYVEGCLINANGSDGIRVAHHSVVKDNLVDFHRDEGNAGIRVDGFTTWVEGNNVTRNDIGIRVADAGNIIGRNQIGMNTSGHFEVAAGNQVGPAGSLADVGDHPWANILYTFSSP